MAQQHKNRQRDHSFDPSSFKCDGEIRVGDLVYLYSDKDKIHSRPRYLVASLDNEWCFLRKFVGNQLRNNAYRVHRSDCYKVPSNDTHSCSAKPRESKLRFPSSAQAYLPFQVDDTTPHRNDDPDTGAPEAPPVPVEITEPLHSPPATPIDTSVITPIENAQVLPEMDLPNTENSTTPNVSPLQPDLAVHEPTARYNPPRLRQPPRYLNDYELR